MAALNSNWATDYLRVRSISPTLSLQSRHGRAGSCADSGTEASRDQSSSVAANFSG